MIAAISVVAAPAPATPGDAAPYSLEAVALLGTNGTDVYLTVSSATDALADRLEKVQVKALPFGGDNLRTSNYFELPAPGGAAVLNLPNLARHRQLQFVAHVKAGDQNNVEAATQVLLRRISLSGMSRRRPTSFAGSISPSPPRWPRSRATAAPQPPRRSSTGAFESRRSR